MKFTKVLPYRIIKVYVSYKNGNSIFISRVNILCHSSTSTYDITKSILIAMKMTRSPSKIVEYLYKIKSISLLPFLKIHRNFDIEANFYRDKNEAEIRYECTYKEDGERNLITGIL